ncbi:hypothetical protein STRPO_1638 [Streptococcus porcinus str. Jelinkova 176]|uniref:Phage protein n=1 Tax=Streptococcus porcinus str. Jelinkova 176 TaxID=873448 RepID=A0ABN0CTY8_STRPO|nr:hypothetical protein STRPO_1638 [Streptococcus porcinus str. Jelinkova 176]
MRSEQETIHLIRSIAQLDDRVEADKTASKTNSTRKAT